MSESPRHCPLVRVRLGVSGRPGRSAAPASLPVPPSQPPRSESRPPMMGTGPDHVPPRTPGPARRRAFLAASESPSASAGPCPTPHATAPSGLPCVHRRPSLPRAPPGLRRPQGAGPSGSARDGPSFCGRPALAARPLARPPAARLPLRPRALHPPCQASPAQPALPARHGQAGLGSAAQPPHAAAASPTAAHGTPTASRSQGSTSRSRPMPQHGSPAATRLRCSSAGGGGPAAVKRN
jgi:hypothetical protein